MKSFFPYQIAAIALLLLSGPTWAQTPAVTGTLPARAATSAPRTGPVTVNFSQPVSAAAAENIRVMGGGVRRMGTVQGGGSSKISFQPDKPFLPGEQVSVTVPAALATPAQVYSFTAAAGVGTGVFKAPYTVGASTLALAVAVGDIDNDGDIDIVEGERYFVRILLNDGQGKFIEKGDAVFTGQFSLDSIFLVDLTGDGILDLLSVESSGGVNLVTGLGKGDFANRQILVAEKYMKVVIADFNADGFTDVVVTSLSNNDKLLLKVFLGTRSGGLSEAYTYENNIGTSALQTADMDGDGNMDLLLMNGDQIIVYLNNGNAQFTVINKPTIINNYSLNGKFITGDFNRDGFTDVISTNKTGESGIIFSLNDGTGNLESKIKVETLSYVDNIAASDLDGDTDLDLIVTNNRGIVQILLNNGLGNFSLTNYFLVGLNYYTQASTADLNGDKALDIITGSINTTGKVGGINIFLNNNIPLPVRASNATLPISLYPNPAHDQLILQLPATTKVATVAVLNTLGQQIAALPTTRPAADGRVTLPVTGVAAGVYVVQVEADNVRTTQRVVIE